MKIILVGDKKEIDKQISYFTDRQECIFNPDDSLAHCQNYDSCLKCMNENIIILEGYNEGDLVEVEI